MSETLVPVEQLTCLECGVARATKRTPRDALRLPKGWKPGPICADCWGKKYLLRAVEFPVRAVIGAEWPAFLTALYAAWQDTTVLANWLMTELHRRDPGRLPGDAKLRPLPKIYLYPDAWPLCPNLYRAAVAALEQQAQAKYRKHRFELVWQRARALPTFAFPVPYGVPNANWMPSYSEDNCHHPLVSVPLNGQRFALRLAGGDEFRRQLRGFTHFLANRDCRGELSLYRKVAGGQRRQGATDHENGGGRKQSYLVMCKLAGWLPRAERIVQSERGMTVTMCAEHFLVAQADHAAAPFVVNADHVRRLGAWIHRHADYLERVAFDTKYEKRNPPHQQLHLNEARSERCRKNANRIKTALQQIVASLVAYAVRQGVTTLVYDDGDRSFSPSFPWFRFREMLGHKCDEFGLAISEVVNTETDHETPEVPAE